jgi:uncharacterized membrane protein
LISLLVLCLACALFWGTAVSTSWARINALETIETYGFAVHQQLLYNFAVHGDFFQTIHMGYDDAWTWSGHRSVTLVGNGLLYSLSPSALWLSKIHIAEVLAGVIPAALLGRLGLKSDWGLLLGGLLYLGAPPTLALALQDYQDLVLAAPALLVALVGFSAQRAWIVVVLALVGCLPREECVPLVVACAAIAQPPANRSRRTNLLIGLGVAALYTAVTSLAFPMANTQHDMPLQNALLGLFHWPPQIFLDGWPFLTRFYALLWAPLGFLALLSPVTLLPGVGLLLFHMTVPWGHGVDRSWGAHVHHMGPLLPFFVAATILGLCRALRWIQGARRIPVKVRTPMALALLVGLVVYGFQWDRAWYRHYNVVAAWTPRAPAYTHPAWELVRLLPDDAVPIVSKTVSLAVSDRSRSFTWDDSLHEKAPGTGLGAGTHLITDKRNTPVLAWAMAMEGASVLQEAGPYVLVGWNPGAVDLQVPTEVPHVLQDLAPWPGMPPHRQAIAGVPPRVAPPPPPQPLWDTQPHTGPGEKPRGGPAAPAGPINPGDQTPGRGSP